MDGQLHRFSVEVDKNGGKSGAYIIHSDGMSPNWFIQDYHIHDKMIHCYFGENGPTYDAPPVLSPGEKLEYLKAHDLSAADPYRATPRKSKSGLQEKTVGEDSEARKQAILDAWREYSSYRANGNPCEHPYLLSKGIDTQKLPQFCFLLAVKSDYSTGDICRAGDLLAPFVDTATGEFRGLQRIYQSGGKFRKGFYKGTSSKGCCVQLLPNDSFTNMEPNTAEGKSSTSRRASLDAPFLFVCEGLATGITIFTLADNLTPVFCALSCGNISNVAQALRITYPDKRIIIAADNDESGLKAANEAIAAGYADKKIVPPNEGEDWNDFCCSLGRNGALTEFTTQLNSTNDTANSPACTAQISGSNTSKEDSLEMSDSQASNASMQSMQNDEILTSASVATPLKYPVRKQYSYHSVVDLVKKPAPIEYLIDGQVQARASHIFFGNRGIKKTFVTLDMALSIACEDIPNWHGMDIEHGPVVYFAGEGCEGLRKRIYGWCLHHNVNPENVQLTVFDEIFRLNQKTDSEHSIEETIANIKNVYEAPKLVIIDTYNKYFDGDENNSGDTTDFHEACEKLIRELGCAVISITHSGHSQESKGRARGSTVIEGSVEIVTQFSARGDSVELNQQKHRDGEKITDLVLDFDKVTLPPEWNRRNGQPETTLVPKLSPFSTHDKQGVPATQQNQPKLNATQKRGRETFKEAVKRFGILIVDKQTGHKMAAVHIEKWRKVSYELSSSVNQTTLRSEYNRQRKQLVEIDGILVKREIEHDMFFCLDLESKTPGDEGMKIALLFYLQYTKPAAAETGDNQAGGGGAAE